MERVIPLLGIVLLLLAALWLSERRGRIPWRLVGIGLGMQFVIALLLLRTGGVVDVFEGVARFVNGVIRRADAGIEFIFGPALADPGGPWGFVFAVKVLPVIIFFAALMGVLYHVGVMQRVVAVLAWLLRRTLGVTGVEALAMASNVFVGQTEAPLCVRPYLSRMTRAQVATLMVGGFATIAGSVLAAYAGILGGEDDAQRTMFIKHLLTASIISAPAALVVARMLVPETETPVEESGVGGEIEEARTANVFDAAAAGASDGLKLALNVAAMLVAFVALLALVNWPISAIGDWGPVRVWLENLGVVDRAGVEHLDLQTLLGAAFMPLAWAMGVAWQDASLVGTLMGEKLVVTEFLAYQHLGTMVHAPGGAVIGERSQVIATYALCGFANFASIGIQVGGLSALAEGQRRTLVSLGLKTMLGGAIASWVTACVAGVVV